MRKAIVCVSFVLALFLAWPMLFGGEGSVVSAAVPPPPAAPKVAKVSVAPRPAPESCYKRYERAYGTCGNDGGCRMNAAAAWDACEAAE